jgi:ankyrin repeat protein
MEDNMKKLFLGALLFLAIACHVDISFAVMSPADFVETCKDGTVGAVEAAIKNGVDVKDPNYGWKSLIALVEKKKITKDNLNIVDVLVKNGVDINVRLAGESIIARAVIGEKNLKMIAKLIENGADVNTTMNNGNTLLIWLVNNVGGRDSAKYMEIMSLLLKNKADVNARTDTGDTALTLLARRLLNQEILRSAECMKIMSLLLKNKADVNARTDTGDTALTLLVRLKEPGGIGFWNRFKHNIRKTYNTWFLELLTDYKADVNAQNASGNTALMILAMNAEIRGGISFLLKHGADPTIKNSEGKTALDFLENNANLSKTDEYAALTNAKVKSGWFSGWRGKIIFGIVFLFLCSFGKKKKKA